MVETEVEKTSTTNYDQRQIMNPSGSLHKFPTREPFGNSFKRIQLDKIETSLYRKAPTTTKSDVRFLTHAGIPRTEGFRHGGVRRSTVSFDTDTHRKHLRNGREMPAASFFRRCWHPMVLQTTCSAFGARGLQTFMAIGAHSAPWSIASSSYRMKARDLRLSSSPHPIAWCKLFRTSN